jgi:hypothetical protein
MNTHQVAERVISKENLPLPCDRERDALLCDGERVTGRIWQTDSAQTATKPRVVPLRLCCVSVLNSTKRVQGLALLLRHTHSLSAATSGLGVLTTHTEAPVVTETPVVPDLLEALKVVTELGVDLVGGDLRGLAILEVLPPVEHPSGDLVLVGVLHNVHKIVHLLLGELTSALVHVNVSLLADDVGETATDTLDGAHGVHHLLPAVDVGTKDTQNVLEIATILDDESLFTHTK